MTREGIPQQPQQDWPEPIPLNSQVDLIAFPVDALPPTVAAMVREVSRVVNIELDLPAMIALVVMTLTGSNRYVVRVGDTHEEPMCLWVIAVLPSGERKTAAYEHMVKPVRNWEREALKACGPEHDAEREAMKIHEARAKKLQQRAASEDDPDERRRLLQEAMVFSAERPTIPTTPEITVMDITPESLAERMAQQGGRAAILSDEGGILGHLAGRYNSSQFLNLDVYLKGHAGTELKVHRRNRSADIVSNPTLSMALTVQPCILETLFQDPRLADVGILGRILWCIPKTRVGTREYRNVSFNSEVVTWYENDVRAALGDPVPLTGMPPAQLQITGEGLEVWRRFHDSAEHDLAPGGALSIVPGWGSKLAGAVARIAGGMHLLLNAYETPPPIIAVETIQNAVLVGEYLKGHALAAFGQGGHDARTRLATKLLGWLRSGRREMFSFREIYNANRGVTQELLRDAINVLEDHHWVRPIPAPASNGPGRPPSPKWDVNPSLIATHNTHNSGYSTEGGNSAYCADSAYDSPDSGEDGADDAQPEDGPWREVV